MEQAEKPLSVLPRVLGQLDNRLDKILLFYSQFLNCDILPSTVFANNCGRTALISAFQSFQVGDIWNFSLIPYPILNNFLPTLPETFFILTLIAQIKKLLLFPFQEASCLRKRVWWAHFSFPGDYRNLTSP